jgi:hypothetical protein
MGSDPLGPGIRAPGAGLTTPRVVTPARDVGKPV